MYIKYIEYGITQTCENSYKSSFEKINELRLNQGFTFGGQFHT